jgi:hypothetical protein
MPPSIPAWSNALLRVDSNLSRIKSSRQLCPNDGKYLFPDPGLFCSTTSISRQSLYFNTWISTRDAWIYRVFSASSSGRPLSGQEWRDILSGQWTNIAVSGSKASSRRQGLRELLGNCFEEAGISEGTLTGCDAPPVTLEVARWVLWELFELNFRFELSALDRRACSGGLGAHAESDILTRQDLVMACFPGNLLAGASLLIADPHHANSGLASPSWRDRLPYILALRNVMSSWEGSKTVGFDVPVDIHTEEQLLVLESAAATFYTQTFFDYFGRVALLPHSL